MFQQIKENIRSFVLVAVVAFVLGAVLFGGGDRDAKVDRSHESHEAAVDAETMYTCSMHTSVRQKGPGQCPICGMDLIPVAREETGELAANQLKLSETARKLAQVETVAVERRPAFREVRMVGEVAVDETREGTISAWIAGRIDRMMVDYNGAFVRKGQPIVSIYSPDLYTAQQELVRARQSATDRPSDITRRRLDAVRKKLKLLGLTEKQIDKLEAGGQPVTHIVVTAPMSGIVLHRHVVTGDYVKEGQAVYSVADLSRVWVEFNAYESDLPWIREGQRVQFTVKAHPGKIFTGSVAFVDPLLDPDTRTVRVRAEADNPDGLLKPDMYVNGIVQARLNAQGVVIPTESDDQNPLVIPRSAPLITGRRAVVYVSSGDDAGLFEGREVVLGPRVDAGYVVLNGLQTGESVVVKGNFKIDSELQIQAKASMMYPEDGTSVEHHHGAMDAGMNTAGTDVGGQSMKMPDVRADIPKGTIQDAFEGMLNRYFDVQVALSEDDLERSKRAATGLTGELRNVPMHAMADDLHAVWMNTGPWIKEATGAVKNAADISDARRAFEALSIAMLRLVRHVSYHGDLPLYQYHCPMAFDDKGADWLQNREGTANPYFGSAMYGCGTLEERIHEGAGGRTP